MAKILSCPNCGNNKNLNTNNRITTCSKCGYSWVSVSNTNIKSSEIKVVMDSINHYKYTLNNYNNDDNTFPFYAINNDFIENKNSNKNHLLKVHHVDDDFVKQGYVGINKFKLNSKRPRIYYDDNVDFSIYKNHSERVVSDRSNQEYEISRISPKRKHQTREHQPANREHIFKEREEKTNSLNEYAEKDPEAFLKEYEIVKINEDGSIDVRPKENPNRDYSQDSSFSSNRNSDIKRELYDERLEREEYPERIPSILERNSQLENRLPYDERNPIESQSYLSERETFFESNKNFNNENARLTERGIPNPFTNNNSFENENNYENRDFQNRNSFVNNSSFENNNTFGEENTQSRNSFENNYPFEDKNTKIPNPFANNNSFENNNAFGNRNSQNKNSFANNTWEGNRNSFESNSYEENENSPPSENSFTGVDFNNTFTEYEDYNPQENSQPPKKTRRFSKKTRDRKSRKGLENVLETQQEKEISKKENEGTYLTYEEYQEKRIKNLNEVKEQQKVRRERWKTKNYAPRKLFNKYQKSETKKYSRLDKVANSDFENIEDKNLYEKYLNKEAFNSEKFNREALKNNNISKKLREELINRKEKYPTEDYVYSKKPKIPSLNQAPNKTPLQGYTFSNIDDVINNSQNLDEKLLENTNLRGSVFGKNPRLSFFENLKINSDGTIKEDPLGLNQDYNEFFNKTEATLGEKKYTFIQIFNEIKKRINKDKMSFNLVVLVIIFGFFGVLSQTFTNKPNLEKDEKEINLGKNIVNQIPTIDANPKFKAAQGESDALVIAPGMSGAVKSKELIKTTKENDSQEILSESKKNVVSDLSLEELKQNKLLNNENNPDSTVKTISSFDKTLMYVGQKLDQFFSNVNSKVVSNKWTTENNNKYFEINIDISNKVANNSYKIKTLEITLLDISGNVVATREIHPDIIVRVKETINSTIRIPKAPPLTAKSYVKIKEATVL